MSEALARLEDIRSGPWRAKSLAARERLRFMTEETAERLFRSHYAEPVSDPEEIEFRESFDDALEELQLVELAIACGYLPLAEVGDEIRADMNGLIALPSAKSYVLTYDFVPVRFLAARLGFAMGWYPLKPPPVNPDAAVRYATFLALHSDFSSNIAVERFTMLIDDYRFEGFVDAQLLYDVLRTNDKPDLTEKQAAVLATVTQGLADFVQILGDLFLSLSDEERPLFGCLYAYWLSHFFGVRRIGNEYQPLGVSFENAEPSRFLFPEGLEGEALDAERRRFIERISTLRDTWDTTRALIEKLS